MKPSIVLVAVTLLVVAILLVVGGMSVVADEPGPSPDSLRMLALKTRLAIEEGKYEEWQRQHDALLKALAEKETRTLGEMLKQAGTYAKDTENGGAIKTLTDQVVMKQSELCGMCSTNRALLRFGAELARIAAGGGTAAALKALREDPFYGKALDSSGG